MMSDANSDAVKDLNKAMIGVNSSKDKNETALLMMSPGMNWGEFLTPAPMSIALLGQLMLIAGERDFSLSTPEKGFQYVKYPESFRACLVQVSNSGWTAFNKAHKNMDAIRLYSAQVPDRVKKVVRTLIKGSQDDVEDFLPIELGKIERVSTECLRLAESVEREFEEVMFLTGELLEASSAAKGQYKKAQEEAKQNREIALSREKKERERMETLKKQEEDLQKQVKEAQKGWEKAVDSMPSGVDIVGVQFVETVTNTFSTVLQAAAPFYFGGVKAAAMVALSLKQYVQYPQSGPKQTSQDETATLFQGGVQLTALMIQLTECLDSAAATSGNSEESRKTLKSIRLLSEALNEDLQADNSTNKEVKKYLEEMQQICQKGEQWLQKLSHSPDEIKATAKEASKLSAAAVSLCAKIGKRVGAGLLYSKPPMQAHRMGNSENSAPTSAVDAIVESARVKVVEFRGVLEKQEQRYDKTCDDLKESNDNLQKMLEDLAKFSSEKIADFDTIRDTLTKGMKALAAVREQWQKMVEFFQFITNIIKVCMTESLSSFVEYAKVGKKRVLSNGYSDTDFMRDLIYEQVNQANTTSYVVWSLASTYMDISHKYLMSRMAGLGHLIALDPEKDRQEIEMKRKELMEGCNEAQQAIMQLVLDAKEQFHVKVAKRVTQIERELVKALPPPRDPVRVKELEEAVKKGIEEEAYDVDDFA